MSPTSSRLRADAPSFSPTFASSSPVAIPQASATDDHGLPADPFELSASEMSVSPAELEELEEVEGWVSLMAELEGMEQDHLIELSLRHADKSKIAQIKAAAMSKGKHKAGGHHHKHHHHHAKAGHSKA
ncbi:hypothetical protein C2E20_3619 [Micractinium conductrix]|uniref:Uncharacterized protein n=1 Tax=Micractinium conductrix TaxID=554055 RepID=A0A2P6VG29_9CHLO|nr:hypothetical protein C2E20_3619 [Micractinium conductrix]|eukprot:PSC73029.1 hypothetical protein C2E20_3619 [Micractinium conductrix]